MYFYIYLSFYESIYEYNNKCNKPSPIIEFVLIYFRLYGMQCGYTKGAMSAVKRYNICIQLFGSSTVDGKRFLESNASSNQYSRNLFQVRLGYVKVPRIKEPFELGTFYRRLHQIPLFIFIFLFCTLSFSITINFLSFTF